MVKLIKALIKIKLSQSTILRGKDFDPATCDLKHLRFRFVLQAILFSSLSDSDQSLHMVAEEADVEFCHMYTECFVDKKRSEE